MIKLSTIFELSRDGKPSYLAMEGLRGWAVVLVFFVHFNSLFMPNSNSLWSVFTTSIGHTGVDLFFVLSGFLIYGSLLKPKPFSALDYGKARIKRLYPVFFTMTTLYILLYLFVIPENSPIPNGQEGVSYVLANLTMQPYLFGYTPLMSVAWTLAYEVTFYTLLPFVIFGLRVRQWSPQARLVLLTMLFLFVVGYFFLTLGKGPERFIFFLVGMMLVDAKPYLKEWAQSFSGVVLGIFLVFTSTAWVHDTEYNIMWPVVFGCVGWFLVVNHALQSIKPTRLFTAYPIRYLGNMSYSYYLSHSFGIHVAYQIFTRSYDDIIGSGIMFFWGVLTFCITLLVSAGLFVCIERPLSLGGYEWRN